MGKKCRHIVADFDRTHPKFDRGVVTGSYAVFGGEDPHFGYGDWDIIHSARCAMCKALLSLGPSNDKPIVVQEEIEAATLLVGDDQRYASAMWLQRAYVNGYRAHEDRSGPHGDVGISWRAGWLARELATHDDRETRDASAWGWDPTRPIAGQQPGTACPEHPTANRNADGDCIECARERTEAAQAEEHEIRRSVTAPGISVAIDQLLEDDEAARRDAKERQTALDAARDRPIGAADVFDDEAFDVSDVLPDSEQR